MIWDTMMLMWHHCNQCWKFPLTCQSEADNFGGGPGTFWWFFFNSMFMIWDSGRQDLQLFWLSFKLTVMPTRLIMDSTRPPHVYRTQDSIMRILDIHHIRISDIIFRQCLPVHLRTSLSRDEISTGLGAHFANDLVRWEICLVVIQSLAIRLQQNFAHATTAQLSCHVQNFVAIALLEPQQKLNKISIEF